MQKYGNMFELPYELRDKLKTRNPEDAKVTMEILELIRKKGLTVARASGVLSDARILLKHFSKLF